MQAGGEQQLLHNVRASRRRVDLGVRARQAREHHAAGGEPLHIHSLGSTPPLRASVLQLNSGVVLTIDAHKRSAIRRLSRTIRIRTPRGLRTERHRCGDACQREDRPAHLEITGAGWKVVGPTRWTPPLFVPLWWWRSPSADFDPVSDRSCRVRRAC